MEALPVVYVVVRVAAAAAVRVATVAGARRCNSRRNRIHGSATRRNQG